MATGRSGEMAASAITEAPVTSTRGKVAGDQHHDAAAQLNHNGKCHAATLARSPGSDDEIVLTRADVDLNGNGHTTAVVRSSGSDAGCDDAAAVEIHGVCLDSAVDLARRTGSDDDVEGGGMLRPMRHGGTTATQAQAAVQGDGATAIPMMSAAPGRRQRVFDVREWVLST